MYHFRKTFKNYRGFPNKPGCDFCKPKRLAAIIAETDHARVIKNRVSYDMWDMRRVTEHLMVVPKRHVQSLADLTSEERGDIMDIIAKYEGKEYNVYARARNSAMRSMGHQHTHLIKTSGQTTRGIIFFKKPYFLLRF